MNAVTSHDIVGQIEALQTRLDELDAQADELSLAAVEGDKEAVKQLADIQAQITQAWADKRILATASKSAVRRESQERFAAGAAERAKAHEQAREIAGEIVSKAARVDALIAELRVLLPQIGALETEVWKQLRAAGQTPTGGFVGQRGLSVYATDTLNASFGPKYAQERKKVEDIASAAWRYLIEDEI